jgi:hypothetical protein
VTTVTTLDLSMFDLSMLTHLGQHNGQAPLHQYLHPYVRPGITSFCAKGLAHDEAARLQLTETGRSALAQLQKFGEVPSIERVCASIIIRGVARDLSSYHARWPRARNNALKNGTGAAT